MEVADMRKGSGPPAPNVIPAPPGWWWEWPKGHQEDPQPIVGWLVTTDEKGVKLFPLVPDCDEVIEVRRYTGNDDDFGHITFELG